MLVAAACAQVPQSTAAFPSGPGLLDGLPPQTPGTYRVVGWVLSDQTGKAIANADIRVEGATTGTRTDQYGRYLLPDVHGDPVSVHVRLVGYESAVRSLRVSQT